MSARRPLTATQKAERLALQTPPGKRHPLCAAPFCGKAMTGATNIVWDHRRDGLPRYFFDYAGSGVDPDDPDHQYAMHRKCHDKLYASDAAIIAKTRGQAGERGAQTLRRLTGSGRKIPSRPFEHRRK